MLVDILGGAKSLLDHMWMISGLLRSYLQLYLGFHARASDDFLVQLRSTSPWILHHTCTAHRFHSVSLAALLVRHQFDCAVSALAQNIFLVAETMLHLLCAQMNHGELTPCPTFSNRDKDIVLFSAGR